MPMISLRDWVGAVSYLIESRDVSGAFNLCCPNTPTNAEFTKALAAALHRKAFFAVPAPLMKTGRRRPRAGGARVGQRPAGRARAGRLRLRGRGRARGAGRRALLIAHLGHHPPRALADQHHLSRGGSVDRQRDGCAGPDGLRSDDTVGDHQLQPARRPGRHAQAQHLRRSSPRPGARAGRSPAAAGRRPRPRRTRRRTSSANAPASPSAQAAERALVPGRQHRGRTGPGGLRRGRGRHRARQARARRRVGSRHDDHERRDHQRAGGGGERGEQASRVHPATLADPRPAAGVIHRRSPVPLRHPNPSA